MRVLGSPFAIRCGNGAVKKQATKSVNEFITLNSLLPELLAACQISLVSEVPVAYEKTKPRNPQQQQLTAAADRGGWRNMGTAT